MTDDATIRLAVYHHFAEHGRAPTMVELARWGRGMRIRCSPTSVGARRREQRRSGHSGDSRRLANVA
jgi:hypothetical protein